MAKLGVAVVLHSSVPDGAPKDEADVLTQAGAVSSSLTRLDTRRFRCPLPWMPPRRTRMRCAA